MNLGTIAALVMAALSLAGFVIQRIQARGRRDRQLDEVVNDRIKALLTRGPDAIFGEYDAQATALVEHMRKVISQRDGLTVDVEELHAEVERLRGVVERNKAEIAANRAEISANRVEIARLHAESASQQVRIDELETAGRHG